MLLAAIAVALWLLVGLHLFSPARSQSAEAASNSPVPVYIVNGPLGLYTWADVTKSGALEITGDVEVQY